MLRRHTGVHRHLGGCTVQGLLTLERVKLLTPYKVTGEVLKATENPDCIFLHCLPSFHDFDTTMAASQKELGYDIREVTDEVFLSPNSKVFDEAENRMHTIKAVMVATIGNV